MKILVLVQAVELSRYPELVKAQNETWNSVPNDEVDVYYYYPTIKEPPAIKEGKIIVAGAEDLSYMFINTIRAFREVLHLDWDYIFKTDLSAYVYKEELVRVLTNKPSSLFYGGHMYKDPAPILGTKFLWGEGYALSKDVVMNLIDVYANNPTARLGADDCHIGHILTDKFEWDDSLELWEYYSEYDILPLKHLYRCKNDKADYKPFDDEIKAMHDIHKHLI